MDDPNTVIHQSGDISNLVLFLDKLNNLYLKLINERSLNDLFSKATDILKEVLNWENVSFLLKDDQLINIFNEEEKGLGLSVYIDKYYFLIVKPNQKFNK